MEVSGQMETVPSQHKSSTFSERKKTDMRGWEGRQTQRSRISFKQYVRELLEAVLALGIVSMIGIFLPSTWLQSHLIFCAFFLVVLVITIRYHVITAYTVSFLASGCYGLLLLQQPQTNPSSDMFRIFIEPFLLFVSGIVINEMLGTQRHQLEMARQQSMLKEDSLQEIKQYYQATVTLNEELERQLVGQAALVSTVNEKMARLWGLQGQEQYNAILDIVMHVINAKFCALYMLRNGRMSLCASQQKEISEYTNTVRLRLNVNDVLIRRVIQSRQVCTIRDTLAGGQSTRGRIAMMAGPLVNHCNQIVGVVIVDDIPLLKFLPTTVRLFSSILHMISIATQTVIPVAAIESDVTLPCMSGSEVETAQVAISEANIETAEDDRVLKVRTEHVLPAVRP